MLLVISSKFPTSKNYVKKIIKKTLGAFIGGTMKPIERAQAVLVLLSDEVRPISLEKIMKELKFTKSQTLAALKRLENYISIEDEKIKLLKEL